MAAAPQPALLSGIRCASIPTFPAEREAQIPRFVYFPFGGGRRICIGNQFALMEGQIILNTLAQRFTMELESRGPLKFAPLLTLHRKDDSDDSPGRAVTLLPTLS